MESREKCEQIISMFNNKPLGGPGPGSFQPLVVKFADGGTSRRKTAVSSPDPTWSGQASTDGSVSTIRLALDKSSNNSDNLRKTLWARSRVTVTAPPSDSELTEVPWSVSRTEARAPGCQAQATRWWRPRGWCLRPRPPGLHLWLGVRGPLPGCPPAPEATLSSPPLLQWIQLRSFNFPPQVIHARQTIASSHNVKFPVPVDPYTCLVSGMHGLALGGPGGAGPGGVAPPGAQFVQGPLGYPGMCVINPGPGYASLPNMEPQPGHINPAASPIEESQQQQQQQQPERGQSNWEASESSWQSVTLCVMWAWQRDSVTVQSVRSSSHNSYCEYILLQRLATLMMMMMASPPPATRRPTGAFNPSPSPALEPVEAGVSAKLYKYFQVREAATCMHFESE